MFRKILKILMVLLNVLLLMLGVIIAAMGIWVLAIDYGVVNLASIEEDGQYSDNFSKPGLLTSAAVICIVVGVIMMVVSILAFCGVRKDSKCILAIYAAFLVLLILLDGVIIVLTAVIQDRIKKNLHGALLEGLQNHYDGTVHSMFAFSNYFDRAQVQMECCGVDSYTDFRSLTNNWTEKIEFMVPRTCCPMRSKSLYLEKSQYTLIFPYCNRNGTNIFEQPCYNRIKDRLVEQSFVLLSVTVAIAGFQLIGIVIGICLLRRLKDGDPFLEED